MKTNLEHRIVSLNQQPAFRRVVVPTEQVIETKDGQKVQTEKRVLPGYVLVNMNMSDEAWTVGEGNAGRDRLRRRRDEARAALAAGGRPILHGAPAGPGQVPKSQVEFSLGESVKVTSGRSPTSTARSSTSTRTSRS